LSVDSAHGNVVPVVDVYRSMLCCGCQPTISIPIKLRRNQVPQINLEWDGDDTRFFGDLSQFITIKSTSLPNQDRWYRIKIDWLCSLLPMSIFIFGGRFFLHKETRQAVLESLATAHLQNKGASLAGICRPLTIHQDHLTTVEVSRN
jgi:hypothetical protein